MKNNDIHLFKQIFKQLSKLLNINEWDLYAKYLENTIDSRLNLKQFSNTLNWDPEYVKYFYGDDNEGCKFFCHTNYKNWAKINKHVVPNNVNIAFYQIKKTHRSKQEYFKIYDETTNNSLFQEENEFNIVTKYIFTYNYNFTVPQLEFFSENYYIDIQYKSEILFIQKEKQLEGKNIYKLVCILLKDYKNFNLNDNITWDQMTNDTSIFNHIDNPILICSHIHSKWTGTFVNTKNSQYSKGKHKFSNIIKYNQNNLNSLIIIILTLRNNGYYTAYLPKKAVYNYILKFNDQPVSKDVTGITDFYKEKIKETEINNENIDKTNITYDEWWEKHSCKCDCCSLTSQYKNNFKIFTTQPRKSIELNTVAYMKMFNLFSHLNYHNKQLNKNIHLIYYWKIVCLRPHVSL